MTRGATPAVRPLPFRVPSPDFHLQGLKQPGQFPYRQPLQIKGHGSEGHRASRLLLLCLGFIVRTYPPAVLGTTAGRLDHRQDAGLDCIGQGLAKRQSGPAGRG